MRTLCVVEHEVLRQTQCQLAHAGIPLQIEVFILEAPPEPLDEDIVQRPALPIHADRNALALEDIGEGRAGELRALGRC